VADLSPTVELGIVWRKGNQGPVMESFLSCALEG
jgi:hypothetical protein